LKRGKYFLTGLSVLQAGAAVLCRSAGDRIFGENGSNMGVAINAHLFLDRRPEILDQMKTVSHLAGLRCALPAAWAYRPQRCVPQSGQTPIGFAAAETTQFPSS
jgi:hypothetical protein